MASVSDLPMLERARRHGAAIALVTDYRSFIYADLLDASERVAGALLESEADLEEARVAILAPPGFEYVAALWGVWRSGGIAVPLAVSHPPPEWEYVLGNCGAAALVAHPDFAAVGEVAARLSVRLLTTRDVLQACVRPLPEVDPARRALILYTSGTTRRPKGVVSTHRNIQAQVESLAQAWEWSAADRILHVLPLHHIHGLVNALLGALWSGASCRFAPWSGQNGCWRQIGAGDVTLFMAVPTIYARLVAAWESAGQEERARMSAAAGGLRLAVSGSAALPVRLFDQWQAIAGEPPLERYGMTEIGMALGNPLHGPRRAGHVGTPLPSVEVRLVDDEGDLVPAGEPGEIEVRGPTIFREYWHDPEATHAAFRGGWFRTGDVAIVDEGSYRILGRRSTDILKSGGYKISALEVEETLREHPAVTDCAIVGLEDAEWGQRVAAAVVLRPGASLSLAQLREWARARLAVYKAPTLLLVLEELPRNAMGKVEKSRLAQLFPVEYDPGGGERDA